MNSSFLASKEGIKFLPSNPKILLCFCSSDGDRFTKKRFAPNTEVFFALFHRHFAVQFSRFIWKEAFRIPYYIEGTESHSSLTASRQQLLHHTMRHSRCQQLNSTSFVVSSVWLATFITITPYCFNYNTKIVKSLLERFMES